MLNDESFEKHVSQGEHEGNLEAAGDGFESDEEFVAQLGRVVDPVPREEKAKDGAKKGDEKEERTKKPDEKRVARICLQCMKYIFSHYYPVLFNFYFVKRMKLH